MPGVTAQASLFQADEGPAAVVRNEQGAGDWVLACEHASHRIPHRLGSLGLDAPALRSHIAWDPGALALAERLSADLDAPLVASRVSRLVYDCNRPPDGRAGIAEIGERQPIPGNRGLDEAEVALRVHEVYRPFHRALAGVLAARRERGLASALVTIHSFTPVYLGRRRSVQIGILHDADTRLADALLARAGVLEGLRVRRNQPYGPRDGVTHTLREHGIRGGLLNAMIEIRNDLLGDEASVERIADMLGRSLREALALLRDSVDRHEPVAGSR